MNAELIDELNSLLQTSDSTLRKHWAQRIVAEKIPLASFISLLHGHEKTAQRFTWLIGDLLDTDREVVRDSLPMLYSLRDDMPFPGMQRSVAKCLWYLGIPEELESEAVSQLFEWLDGDSEIGVKHYAAKCLYDLALENRIQAAKLERVLQKQARHENKAHASRMEKLRLKLLKNS